MSFLVSGSRRLVVDSRYHHGDAQLAVRENATSPEHDAKSMEICTSLWGVVVTQIVSCDNDKFMEHCLKGLWSDSFRLHWSTSCTRALAPSPPPSRCHERFSRIDRYLLLGSGKNRSRTFPVFRRSRPHTTNRSICLAHIHTHTRVAPRNSLSLLW